MRADVLDTKMKYASELQKVKYKCKYCGRKAIIPFNVEKQLCSWCKHYVFKTEDDEKRYYDKINKKQFKIKLNNLMKGIKL